MMTLARSISSVADLVVTDIASKRNQLTTGLLVKFLPFVAHDALPYHLVDWGVPGRSNAMIFTALHTMQDGISHDKNVRLSVKRVNCDKTKLMPTFSHHQASFRQQEWLIRDDALYLKFLSQTDPVPSKTPIFNFSLVAPQL